MLQELEYPFDPNEILSGKKRFRRRLLADSEQYISKNIAILGGYTTHDIRQILELFLLNQGIKPSFYESEYNQYYRDAMFPNAELEAFRPDVIYLCTSNRNISRYPAMDEDEEEIRQMVDSEIERYTRMWERIEQVYHCPVIQNNFEPPYYRLLGNKEASDIHGKVNFLNRLNEGFYQYARSHDHFYICDINYLAADYGLSKWSDPFYWHMYKYAVNVNAIPYLAFQISLIIKSIFGKNKKALVLDLDNTLWGGVIGEDGVEGICLGPEESEGQAYSEFQRYIKEQKQIGVLLNIASKNDEENALAGIKHPDSEFSVEDFISIKANWEPKDQNFLSIAQELNLLPESLVFIDDNPAERHIIREQIHGVSAPEIGQVHQYIHCIDRNGFFEVTTLSDDDKSRNEMYRSNLERKKLESSFENYRDYLRSLEMSAVIRPFEEPYLARIAQLTNKSNQFNLTTKRYSQAEIEQIADDRAHITLYGKLFDRFGDNGVVSIVIGRVENDSCYVELWLMSCRVLKREMEYAMMDMLVRRCKELDIQRIIGYYYPTKKNAMVKEFYRELGFEKIRESSNGDTEWCFAIPDSYMQKTDVIKTEEKNR